MASILLSILRILKILRILAILVILVILGILLNDTKPIVTLSGVNPRTWSDTVNSGDESNRIFQPQSFINEHTHVQRCSFMCARYHSTFSVSSSPSLFSDECKKKFRQVGQGALTVNCIVYRHLAYWSQRRTLPFSLSSHESEIYVQLFEPTWHKMKYKIVLTPPPELIFWPVRLVWDSNMFEIQF